MGIKREDNTIILTGDSALEFYKSITSDLVEFNARDKFNITIRILDSDFEIDVPDYEISEESS